MAVSIEEFDSLWRDLDVLERWGHEGWAIRGSEILWNFDRNCWVVVKDD